MKQYVIGMDFGTLSARAILADASDGTVLAEAESVYAHGNIDNEWTGGGKLPPFFALQNPLDYLDALRIIPRLLGKAGIPAADVAGMGIDFTSCTMLPVTEDGSPLAFLPEFRNEPHAYVKVWKHHSAGKEADDVTALAKERGEAWLPDYGGKVSPEWMIPKLLETLRKAPKVFERAARFTEAADWLSFVLTGRETASPAFAGYKAFWNAETGYPGDAFFEALDPRLKGLVGTKLFADVGGAGNGAAAKSGGGTGNDAAAETGGRTGNGEAAKSGGGIAGTLNENGAALTGLSPGTPLALPMIDAHAVMPALRATEAGDLALILGTSGCAIVNAEERRSVEGICGFVKDAVIPGLYTYEAGQPAVGDGFDWFVRNHIPEEYANEARRRGIGIHALLTEKAGRLSPGESGLLALDWLNGNRSILVNAELSGLVLGLTLGTKPEEEYRAWLEAAAYGTRMIFEQFERSGVAIRSVTAAGGIAAKNPLLMQIYADVTGKEIRIAGTTQAGALGSAIYAAFGAGLYPTLRAASDAMGAEPIRTFRPIPENRAVYDALFAEYKTLYDAFGRGENRVMERLSALRRKTAGE